MISDTFLLDEVRCGFLIPAAVKQAWAAELEVLAEIDRVCKKHNIQYFADWGTLLGTVRHGGFVPWDDDLDIVMKREDYIKFMTVARFDMEEGFDVQTFRNHEDCWLFMGKVVNRNGFSFEKEHLRRFHNFPYIACIDVFVLDYVHRDPAKEERRRTLCKYLLTVADAVGAGKRTLAECEQMLQNVEGMARKKFERIKEPVEMRRYLYEEVEKIFGEVPESEADELTQIFPHGLRGNAFRFPKAYYEQSMYLPFEEVQISVPKLYDRMLRQRYGDYMRFVKNKAGHDYPFFEGQKKNLEKVLDFKLPEFQVDKNRVFRGEKEATSKNQSYKVIAIECACELGKMREQLHAMIEHAPVDEEQSELMLQLLQDSQQLAVDLGNMLEQFLGEGIAIIPLLEQYCEDLYVLYEQIVANAEKKDLVVACEALERQQKSITDELEQSVLNRKCKLFLPVLAKDWCSLEHLWESAEQDPHCDVLVVPLPYFYKDYDGSPRRICYEAAEFPEELQVLDYQGLTAEYLEMLHPEEIIIQNPYDSWNAAISVPDMFYAEQLRKYTDELVYVSPFVVDEFAKWNEREYGNMKYYVTMPGVVYADRVLVQSEKMRQVYIERLAEFAGEDTKAVWEQRVETVFLSAETKQNKTEKQKKKILYGISVGAYMEQPELTKQKLESNLQLFEEYKESIECSILIFPDIHADDISADIFPILGTYSDKLVTEEVQQQIGEYDAYYGDAMPLVMTFRDAGKPAMIQDYACL